ncbi:MAG: peptide transporter substrate-binding protein [Bacillales bacterium]|jgi:oligopeptide transport system substrate-binding protein|nr:peptide transporter substrate-binding protein [Bacillales bacterium]
MKTKKLSILLVLVLAISSILMACGEKAEPKKTPEKKSNLAAKQELNLLDSSEIPSLDSSIATDQVSFLVMTNVMEGLYRLGENDKVMPGLAKSEKVSSDGKTYTFKLRDAKWSNGEKIVAADFVYAWQRAVDPKTASEYAYMLFPVLNGEACSKGEKPVTDLGIKAVDESTLEVKLANAAPYFKSLLSFPTFFPQQQKFVEAEADKYGTEFDKVLYNGPFKLTSWEHEVGWTYEANDQYWDKEAVKLTKINVKVVKDNNTAESLYSTGAVDRTGLIAEQVPKYKDREDFGRLKDTAVYFLRMNQKNPVLANKDARKAIAMAFDKTQLCDVLLNNGSLPANYLVPSEFLFDKNNKDFREANGDMNAYNVKKAQEHWTAAKAALGKDAITLKLLNYDSESAKKIGEFLKEQLQKNLPGLTIEVNGMPFAVKLDTESKMDYDLSYAGWGPDYADPMTFLDMFVTDGGHNQMGYSSKAYDDIIKAASTTLISDLDKRWTELQKAEKILIEEDQAIAPLYQRGSAFVLNPKVKNIFDHKFGGDFSYKWTYLEK